MQCHEGEMTSYSVTIISVLARGREGRNYNEVGQLSSGFMCIEVCIIGDVCASRGAEK